MPRINYAALEAAAANSSAPPVTHYGPKPPELLGGFEVDRFSKLPERHISMWFEQLALETSGCARYQHEYCWGWTILRVSYADDPQFARAVASIQRLATIVLEQEYDEAFNDRLSAGVPTTSVGIKGQGELGPELALEEDVSLSQSSDLLRQPTDDFIRRYHHNVIEDKANLGGADPVAAQDYFTNSGLQAFERGIRQRCFIYLDQTNIDHLAAAPDEDTLAAMDIEERSTVAWQHWVKLVGAHNQSYGGIPEPQDDYYQQWQGETEEDMQLRIADDERIRRRRLRLRDLLELFLTLNNVADMSEVGIEGVDQDHPPPWQPYETPEWLFCVHMNA